MSNLKMIFYFQVFWSMNTLTQIQTYYKNFENFTYTAVSTYWIVKDLLLGSRVQKQCACTTDKTIRHKNWIIHIQRIKEICSQLKFSYLRKIRLTIGGSFISSKSCLFQQFSITTNISLVLGKSKCLTLST